MFKKLYEAFSARFKTRADAPYDTEQLNTVHNMLFADDVGQLFGAAPDPRVVQAIAQDSGEESRVRLLAAQWLRAHGHQPAEPQVLGVVIEVPLDDSMDTLAAYADGRVRYIDQNGGTTVFEGGPGEVAEQARALVALAAPAFPTARQHKPAFVPQTGQLRFTILSQDGNRVVEGLFGAILRDELAKPILEQGRRLMDLVVRQASAQ